jgi:GNAT superfamily N-acetyltransferase
MLAAMVREFQDGDAEAAAELIAVNTPWLQTAAGLRHRLATLPPRARRATWVAEDRGALVGYAEAEFDWVAERRDIGHVWALVDPAHRQRGLGSALFECALDHVTANGAGEIRSWSFADSDGFLEKRGFTPTRVERLSAVDPRTVDTSALESLPVGIVLAPMSELDHRLREVYELFMEAIADMPSDHPQTNLSYEEWLTEALGDPDLSRQGSFVVLADDRPASLSWVKVDPTRGFAEQELTGTARTYRRRGLARVAKLAVLRWCASQGITRLATGNDATNVGMIAINDELGFRPFAAETEWVRRLR